MGTALSPSPTSTSQRAFPSFAFVVTATLSLLCGAAAAAHQQARPSVVALFLVAASVPYLGLLVAPLPRGGSAPWCAVLCALVPGVAMVLSPSALSDDLYRFAWDAHAWLSGRNAYAFAPASPALAGMRHTGLLAHINHPTIPTVYPPLAQGLFVAGYGLGGLPGLKALALAGHLCLVAAMPWCVRSLSPAATRTDEARAIWLWSLNPLAISEAAMGAHFDGWLGLSLLLAAALLVRRPWSAAACLVASAGLKLVGLFALPLLWRRSRLALLCALLLSLALSLPLLTAGQGDHSASGIGHFAQRWQGNTGLFSLVESLVEPFVLLAASDVGGPGNGRIGHGEVSFDRLRPLLTWARNHGAHPSQVITAERKAAREPGILPRRHATGLAARVAAVLMVLSLALWLGTHNAGGAIGRGYAMRAVLLSLLLLSPQVHAWYLLWLLPLEIALERTAVVVWSVVILGSYAPLDAWQTARQWHACPWFAMGEYTLVTVCLLAESRVILRTSLTRLRQRFTLERWLSPR